MFVSVEDLSFRHLELFQKGLGSNILNNVLSAVEYNNLSMQNVIL